MLRMLAFGVRQGCGQNPSTGFRRARAPLMLMMLAFGQDWTTAWLCKGMPECGTVGKVIDL